MGYNLYNKISYDVSDLFTKRYSTSFSLAIKVFDVDLRQAINSVYGFVRLADEIVDSFHDFDKAVLMREIREDVHLAVVDGISINPIINSFQLVVNSFGIPMEYIDKFLDSMEMDLTNNYYHGKEYDKYIYGSAEVVGLMCLKVFCDNDKTLFAELEQSARALGSAFQKVNFLRDISSDLSERGRIYLRNVSDLKLIDNRSKILLENEIEEEFKVALSGIKKLPRSAMLGVYSAYLYYSVLFKKIKSLKVNDLLSRRVRISNLTKFSLLCKSIIRVRLIKAF
ncbi:MAG: phytoene/squalene synthase family protein [bacterium]|nr:phytoene/squalene synthase family protein [bacterium]